MDKLEYSKNYITFKERMAIRAIPIKQASLEQKRKRNREWMKRYRLKFKQKVVDKPNGGRLCDT